MSDLNVTLGFRLPKVNWRLVFAIGFFIGSILFLGVSIGDAIYDIPNGYDIVFPADKTYNLDWDNVIPMPLRVEIDKKTPSQLDYMFNYVYADPYSEFEGKKVILLVISSYGGYVGDSIASYDIIMRWRERFESKGMRIYTFAEGYACSGGSLILMAGEKKFVSKTGRIMIHKPYQPSKPNTFQFKLRYEIRDDLDRIDAIMRGIYLTGTGNMKVVDDFDSGADIWYTPEQALADGVVDGII